LALIASMMLVAPAAWAQEDGETESSAETAPAESGDKHSKALFPRISDDEETIYTVQRKAYLVREKIELTLNPAYASFTDRFVQTFGFGGSVTYHVGENFGIELGGAYMIPFESDLTTEILREGKLTPEIAKLTQMLWAAGLGVQWSPIYGKIEIFDKFLGNFGIYVTTGMSVGQTRVQCTPATPLDPEVFGTGAECETLAASGDPNDAFKTVYEPARTTAMVHIGGGFRFFFADFIGLRVEVKDYLFPARVYRPGSRELTQRYTDAIRNNVFFNVGVSFLFGGEDN